MALKQPFITARWQVETVTRAHLRAAVVKSCHVWPPPLPPLLLLLPQGASSILCQLLPFRSRLDARGHKMSVWRLVFESFGSQIVVTSFQSKAASLFLFTSTQSTKPRGGGGGQVGLLITAPPGRPSLHRRRDGGKAHLIIFHSFILPIIHSFV